MQIINLNIENQQWSICIRNAGWGGRARGGGIIFSLPNRYSITRNFFGLLMQMKSYELHIFPTHSQHDYPPPQTSDNHVVPCSSFFLGVAANGEAIGSSESIADLHCKLIPPITWLQLVLIIIYWPLSYHSYCYPALQLSRSHLLLQDEKAN